jgi:hypothetical protein
MESEIVMTTSIKLAWFEIGGHRFLVSPTTALNFLRFFPSCEPSPNTLEGSPQSLVVAVIVFVAVSGVPNMG